MSNTNIATFPQALHALSIISQQNPSKESLQKLYSGYLSALVKAVGKDNLPSLVDFKKFLGLASLPQVTSGGRTGADSIRTMTEKGFNLSKWAKDVLVQEAFNASITNGMKYEPVVILGSEFPNEERRTKNIREVAQKRGYITPPAELAPLLCEALTDEELKAMGLWWLSVMHEPITDSAGDPSLLALSRNDGVRELGASWGNSDYWWGREGGFVFLAPQGA